MLNGTSGASTLIDDVDEKFVCSKRWYATRGYACRTAYIGGGRVAPKYKAVALHRQILERKLGRKLLPGEDCEHKNRDRLDNRRANLRVASRTHNNANSIRDNRSGFTGVMQHQNKNRVNRWFAYIAVEGKRYYLGYFKTAKEAAYVRDQFAIVLHGEYARTNVL